MNSKPFLVINMFISFTFLGVWSVDFVHQMNEQERQNQKLQHIQRQINEVSQEITALEAATQAQSITTRSSN